MTRRLPPPYLRLVGDPVSSAAPSPHDPAVVSVRMQSTADAARHLLDATMDGLMNAALDYGCTDAFGPTTRDAIAKIVSRDLDAWAAQWITTLDAPVTADDPHTRGNDGHE